ncbi:O-antigen/teichoic acid export membrane protein [Novosphingobium kunmingense]|uniref:O-antigen/teichoic acid export membrane protein n=1 Tax=Novosphingobium kunmingense TaxID=1211806 RepID=A0A2N0HK08_9SPHN|nr:hypothetical protein [Novosphingobium kunmingense]PKB19290.1 O-antigen/teichoic acid export membrane protein [Novosphingobium kunmingense]
MSSGGKGRAVSSSAWALVNTLASMAPSFVSFVLVTNWLGAGQLGLLALVGAALFPLRFADLGLSGAVTRYVGAYQGAQAARHMREIVWLSWAISALAFAVLVAICLIVAPPLLARTIDPSLLGEARRLMPLLIAAAAVQLLFSPLMAGLLGRQRFRLVYGAGTAVAVVQLVLVGPLILAFGIAGMVLAQIAQLVLVTLIFGAVVFGARDGKAQAVADADRLDRRGFVRFAMQVSGSTLLTTLVEPVTKLVLGSTVSLAVMGLYEVLWRILMQFRTLLAAPSYPIGVALIGSWQAGRDAARADFTVLSLLAWFGAAAVLAAAPAALLAYDLVTAGQASQWPGALVAGAIGLSLALGFMTVPSYFLSMAANRMAPVIAGTLANLALQLGLGGLAGVGLGWQGALWLVVLAYAVSALVQMGLAWRLLDFPPLPHRTDLSAAWLRARRAIGRSG